MVFVCAGAVFGVDRFVPSGSYPTIQSGIDEAGPGDRVIISAGSYNENLDFLGKAITLSSTNPADHWGLFGLTIVPIRSTAGSTV